MRRWLARQLMLRWCFAANGRSETFDFCALPSASSLDHDPIHLLPSPTTDLLRNDIGELNDDRPWYLNVIWFRRFVVLWWTTFQFDSEYRVLLIASLLRAIHDDTSTELMELKWSDKNVRAENWKLLFFIRHVRLARHLSHNEPLLLAFFPPPPPPPWQYNLNNFPLYFRSLSLLSRTVCFSLWQITKCDTTIDGYTTADDSTK